MKYCDREVLFGFCQGFLKADEAERVRVHVAECAACRAVVEEYGRLDALLDDWRPVEPSPWFDARVRAAVAGESAAPARRRFFGLQWARWLAPALGVVLVLVAALAIWRTRRSPEPATQQVATSPAVPQVQPPVVTQTPEPAPVPSPPEHAAAPSPMPTPSAAPQVAAHAPAPVPIPAPPEHPATPPTVTLTPPPSPPQVATHVPVPVPKPAPPDEPAVATLPIPPVPPRGADQVVLPAPAPQVAQVQPVQTEPPVTVWTEERELSFYENLSVLEDYDLLASLDVLSELPRKGNRVGY